MNFYKAISAIECGSLVVNDGVRRLDRSVFKSIAEIWPDWLNPKGSRK